MSSDFVPSCAACVAGDRPPGKFGLCVTSVLPPEADPPGRLEEPLGGPEFAK